MTANSSSSVKVNSSNYTNSTRYNSIQGTATQTITLRVSRGDTAVLCLNVSSSGCTAVFNTSGLTPNRTNNSYNWYYYNVPTGISASTYYERISVVGNVRSSHNMTLSNNSITTSSNGAAVYGNITILNDISLATQSTKTLTLNAGGSITGSGVLTNIGTVVLNSSIDSEYSGSIVGATNITKLGSADLLLTGASNDIRGNISITADASGYG